MRRRREDADSQSREPSRLWRLFLFRVAGRNGTHKIVYKFSRLASLCIPKLKIAELFVEFQQFLIRHRPRASSPTLPIASFQPLVSIGYPAKSKPSEHAAIDRTALNHDGKVLSLQPKLTTYGGLGPSLQCARECRPYIFGGIVSFCHDRIIPQKKSCVKHYSLDMWKSPG